MEGMLLLHYPESRARFTVLVVLLGQAAQGLSHALLRCSWQAWCYVKRRAERTPPSHTSGTTTASTSRRAGY